MKRILKALLVGMLSIAVLVGCGNDDATTTDDEVTTEVATAEDVELDTDKVYKMGMDDTFAPMGFRDDKGNLVGFDVDMAEDIAERIGIELELQPVDWSMKEAELNNGSIDFIWNGYSITPAREEEVAFSTPYLANRQIIVTMADSDVETKEDLYDKNITVQAESSALDAINKDEAFVDSLENPFIEFATNVECFNDVEAGRSDAIVVDEVLARYYMKQNGEDNYKVLEDDFGAEEFGIGMRKDDTALIEAVNNALIEQEEDGTYDEIYSKWFSE